MRRYALAAIAALAISVSVFGTAARSQDASRTVVFAVGEWPPFVSEIENGYGVHSRMVTKVYEEAGYRVVYEFMPWQRAAASTKAGQYVATFPWQRSPERLVDYQISQQSLGPNRSVAYYEASRFPDGIKGTTLQEMAEEGYSFVGVRSYIHTVDLAKHGANLHIVSNSRLAWMMLARGRIDIYVDNELVGDTESVEFLGPVRARDFAKSVPVSDDPLYILFSRNHDQAEELREIWDSAMTH
ncbi:substrate-binding periplasmic protein [Pacificispira sp.]|uniref:substrate-binding periplasmic protein n=1 Tax=Pacificispira sp. TaxID=2888761 RepID=UPI003BA948AF